MDADGLKNENFSRTPPPSAPPLIKGRSWISSKQNFTIFTKLIPLNNGFLSNLVFTPPIDKGRSWISSKQNFTIFTKLIPLNTEFLSILVFTPALDKGEELDISETKFYNIYKTHSIK